MTRTKKGQKPVGWDYWGKRPIGLGANGTKAKRVGIKKERSKLKREIKKEADMTLVKNAYKWGDMAGDTELEQMLNAYLTTRFIHNKDVPADECLEEARKVIEVMRAYGDCSDPGAAWDALGREEYL